VNTFHIRPSVAALGLVLIIAPMLNASDVDHADRNRGPVISRSTGTAVAPLPVQQRDSLAPGPRALDDPFAAVRLHFEVNHGQTDPRVKFLARGAGYTLFLTPSEAVWSLERPVPQSENPAGINDRQRASIGRPAVLRMSLVGGESSPLVEGFEPLPGRVNYFKGSDPGRWQRNVPTYGRVRYHGVYPGIDVEYYGNERALEYDFVVAPGADPSRIRMAFNGASEVTVGPTGDLSVLTEHGEVRLKKPFIFQERNGRREEIHGGYIVDRANGSVMFGLGEYDRARPLVIDPVLLYSSYFGGSGSDTGTDIAVDSSGSLYVTGYTSSLDFPLATADQPAHGGGDSDLFVARLNASGTDLLYSTYLGSGGGDAGMGITIDAAGNAYVTGLYSMPPSFGQSVLVAKFSPVGALVYGSVFGTASGDVGYAVAVDAAGYAYVAGRTGGASNFPVTASAFQPIAGGFQDGFVSVLSPDGGSLVYSSYLGGDLNDQARAIVLDAAGYVYVAGGTMTGFPTTAGAFQRTVGGFGDAFVAKINVGQTGIASLVYSTLLGGSDFEVAYSLAVNNAGNVYVTGSTDSGFDFPTTPGAFQTVGGGGNCGTFDRPRHCQDAFVTKLNAAGSGLIYSTFLGGLGHDFGNGIAVDGSGSAYVVGQAFAADFPVVDALQPAKASGCCTDGFITKLSPTGNALVYSTYLGGAADDFVSDVALDAAGNAFVIGAADSTNFPLVNALQPVSRGSGDAFIAKIGGAACTFTVTPASRSVASAATTGTISIAPSSASCGWSATSSANWLTITGNASGTGNGTISYAASANTNTTARTASILAGGKTFTLTQSGATAITMTVTSPNGGEQLYANSSYQIAWTASGTVASFDVAASTDGGTTFVPVPGCAALAGSARSCTWAAPSPVTANGRIRVTARDAAGGSVSDASNAAFSIVTGSGAITVTYPNNAVNVGIGSMQRVAWSHNLGSNSYVKIELSRNGGATYTETLGVVPNASSTSGSFAWRVTGPATSGAQARIRVSAVSMPAADYSNANFTIAPPFIAVTAPAASANWGFGTKQRQQWTTNLGELDRVDVQLSVAGASGPFTTLSGGANLKASAKGVNITVPATATLAARVRIVWNNAPAGASAVAISPADFRVQPPFITVTSPAAGVIWTVGTPATVSWSHNLGTLENVKIELSRDNGVTYSIVLASSTVSDGSQNMTVLPAWGPQTTTRVKITWLRDTTRSGQSAAFVVR
jgi:hypothetical protein